MNSIKKIAVTASITTGSCTPAGPSSKRGSLETRRVTSIKSETKIKDKDYLLETLKVIALIAIAVELFCLVYAIWPMIPIYD